MIISGTYLGWILLLQFIFLRFSHLKKKMIIFIV